MTGTRDTRRDVLVDAVARASRYLATVNDRPVSRRPPRSPRCPGWVGLCRRSPSTPRWSCAFWMTTPPPPTVATAGPRYFGFVTGGPLPAALGATVLAAAWDQNASLEVMSPAVAALASWATTEPDIDRSVEAVARVAKG